MSFKISTRGILKSLLQNKKSKANTIFFKIDLHNCNNRCLKYDSIHLLEKIQFFSKKQQNLQLPKTTIENLQTKSFQSSKPVALENFLLDFSKGSWSLK